MRTVRLLILFLLGLSGPLLAQPAFGPVVQSTFTGNLTNGNTVWLSITGFPQRQDFNPQDNDMGFFNDFTNNLATPTVFKFENAIDSASWIVRNDTDSIRPGVAYGERFRNPDLNKSRVAPIEIIFPSSTTQFHKSFEVKIKPHFLADGVTIATEASKIERSFYVKLASEPYSNTYLAAWGASDLNYPTNKAIDTNLRAVSEFHNGSNPTIYGSTTKLSSFTFYHIDIYGDSLIPGTTYLVYVNNKLQHSRNDFMPAYANWGTGHTSNWGEMVDTSADGAPSVRYLYSKLYQDFTWVSVKTSTSSTWAATTFPQPQRMVKSGSDNSASIVLNIDAFPPGSPIYLYSCYGPDCDTNGYLLNPAPTPTLSTSGTTMSGQNRGR